MSPKTRPPKPSPLSKVPFTLDNPGSPMNASPASPVALPKTAMQTMRGMTKRQVLNFLLIVGSALMIWKGLGCLAESESPIVVVLSESMEPAFQRGDLLFLTMSTDPLVVGDICVFKIEGKEIPIVHRVIELHEDNETGLQYLLTKGDNNEVDDRGLYNPLQMWIQREDVIGKVRGMLPHIGMITIVLNDYPQLKVALLVVLGIFVLFSKDE